MNRLLLTTALGLALSAGGAQAQSVLERVLGKINGNTNMETVNGVFANIAENIGTMTGTWLYAGQATLDRVSFAKIGSWYLLLYVAFTTVTLVNRMSHPQLRHHDHQRHHHDQPKGHLRQNG